MREECIDQPGPISAAGRGTLSLYPIVTSILVIHLEPFVLEEKSFYSQYNTVVACHMCLSLHKPLLSPFSTACTKYDLYRTSLCYKNLRVRPQLPMLLVAWRIKAPLLYHPTTYTSSATTLGKPTSNEERD